MTFTKALEQLLHDYNYAARCEWIEDPVAWALYQVCIKAEQDRKKKAEKKAEKVK